MNKLWGLLAVALAVAFIIQYRDKRMHLLNPNEKECDKLFTTALILYLGIFCGLRTWYNDTVTYIGMYESLTPTIDHFVEANTYSFAEGIGFAVLNSFMKTVKACARPISSILIPYIQQPKELHLSLMMFGNVHQPNVTL